MKNYTLCAAAIMLLAAVCAAHATADPLPFYGESVYVYYGTAQLYSAGGQYLSTKTEEQVFTTQSLSELGPDLVAQIQADATVPSYLSQNLGNFISSDGLGSLGTLNSTDFYNTLTSNPTPLSITSDTGLVAFGQPFAFEYYSALPDYQVVTNVSFYTETIQETVSAVPEPRYWALVVLELTGIVLVAARRRRAISHRAAPECPVRS